jgi:hypothetical protein
MTSVAPDCELANIQGQAGPEKEMKKITLEFLLDETGQDLIEYTLLLAFVALASAAVFRSLLK